jgi:uncharacterized protein (TIGR03083 family)
MDGIETEGRHVVDLVAGMDAHEWIAPTRCDGWVVRDVAAHLAGLFTDVALGRMAGQGLPEVTQRQADERRDRSPEQLAAELKRSVRLCRATLATFNDRAWLAPAPGGFPGPLRRAVLVLWYELFVHGDDLRCATGRADRRGPGLRAASAHLAETLGLWGWGSASLHLPPLEVMEVRGGGPRVELDPLDFVRTATGRIDPATVGLDHTVNIYGSAGAS